MADQHSVEPLSTPARGAADSGGLTPDAWTLLETLPVPMAVNELGGAGAVRFVNTAFVETFGYTLDDVPTTAAWAERAYPDPAYRAEVMGQWFAEIEGLRGSGGVGAPKEYRLFDKAGRMRQARIGFTLSGDLLIVTFQDLTDVRTAESALEAQRRKNERTAFALTENMPAGAYTMVLAPGEEMAKFSFVSTRFLDMLDLNKEETVADPMAGFACVHPDDGPSWVARNAEAFAARRPFSEETRVVVRGETRWVRAESVPRELEDGSIVWEGILVDITRLKETEQHLKDVLVAADAYAWRRDVRNRRIENDRRWRELVGLPTTENRVADDIWTEQVHPDEVETVRTTFEALDTGKLERAILTYRRQTAQGRWIWLQVHAGINARDEKGQPTTVLGVTFDINETVEQRLAEQEKQADLREDLQRAQQRDTVAQIAGAVSHDLNNLIGLILWTADSLEARADPESELAEGLATIRKAVDKARDLTAGLGSLIRPSLPRTEHDLRDLLPDMLDLLGSRRIQRHAVQLDLPEEPMPVWGNPTEILQVVLNLTINACDSGGPDKAATVLVRGHPAGTFLPSRHPDAGEVPPRGCEMSVFTVTDTGAGIPPEVRARMFQRNFTTKGEAGTGLGLLIVASILRGNHAALWIDTAPGDGTTMTVAWPASAVDGAADPARGVSDGRAQLPQWPDPDLLSGVQALVVDDLPDVAEILAEMLESAGAVAVSETDPDVVKEVLSEAPQDWSVLVTDLHMPGTDGHALARFAMSLSPPVPVVLVTARPDTLGDFSLRDFADVLAKPVLACQLAEAVHRAVSRGAPIKMAGEGGNA